jgi:site-specific DNA recombinase
MKRAAIYARFSTDLQNERSIEDQVALCRCHAERDGLLVVEVFEDRARSGASLLNRDGLLRLVEQSKVGAFDVVVVEALDRLSRDMEDLAGLHKRLTFRGIEIRAVNDGRADTVTVGLRAIVGQLQREDGVAKTRRGMAGVIQDKRHAGGRAYGYISKPGEPGRLVIVQSEAKVVCRIFREFVRGNTARDIAHRLNADRIAPPRGKAWNASTINGNGRRGNGLVRNELYVGRLVWNKVGMVKDPDTGKRVSRPNPREAWHVVEVPELAIVPVELFEAAQSRIAAREGVRPERQRRARHLLTGLLRCGACGSGMSTYGKDKTGRKRLRCTRDAESGTCPRPRTFYLDTIESAILNALRNELREPEVITDFVRTYHEERRRLASQQGKRRAAAQRRLGEIDRETTRVVDNIAKGHGDPVALGRRSFELRAEREAIEQELAAVDSEPVVLTLHPAALARYEEMLGRLQQAIAAGMATGNPEYSAAIRDLIESVTLRPGGAPGRVEVEIAGRLTALIGPEAFPNGRRGVGGTLVAGAGLEPATSGL